MRYPGHAFDEIWDYYTLGERIPGLEEDKEKIRGLMNLTNGAETGEQDHTDRSEYTRVRRKTAAIYISLSTENSCPAPKICL